MDDACDRLRLRRLAAARDRMVHYRVREQAVLDAYYDGTITQTEAREFIREIADSL